MVLTGELNRVYSAFSFGIPEMAPPTMVWLLPHQSSFKKMVYSLAYSLNLGWEVFVFLFSFFLGDKVSL